MEMGNNSNMKYLFILAFIFTIVTPVIAQTSPELTEGKVTYLSSQNVYVRFASTEGLKVGDTLYSGSAKVLKPVLKIVSLSSTSCVCIAIDNAKFTISQSILTNRIHKEDKPKEVLVSQVKIEKPIVADTLITPVIEKKQVKSRKQLISGRIYATSYSDFSNMMSDAQRMKLGFTLNAAHINNSRLSAETYISFYVKNNGWEDIKKDVFNGLKIYSLALKYEFNDNTLMWFGRKINPRVANMGAIDGLQLEYRHNSITTGLIVGSRPDYQDYGFNAKLLQYGGYISHDINLGKNLVQNTLAIIQQTNSGKTDRRFAYFQHNSTWFRNLNFFGSAEVDLYKKVYDSIESVSKVTNSASLTNLYLSIRYNVTRNLGFTLSYSERQNIIYYETYKTIIDQLLAAQASKGYRFSANYRPGKMISMGLNAGYNFQKNDPKPSQNIYGYLSYNRIPWLKAMATLSATALESSYLSGKIFSLGLSRGIFSDRMNLGLTYRMVDYTYEYSKINELQHIAELSLDTRIYRKLSISLNYEGTFIKSEQHNRVYVQLMQRF
jgi:hypothetical protein